MGGHATPRYDNSSDELYPGRIRARRRCMSRLPNASALISLQEAADYAG